MKICPFCGEGPIYKAKVKTNSELIYICGECDLVWTSPDINLKDAVSFAIYMSNLGKDALWNYLELITAI